MSDFIIAPSASRDLNQISEYFLSRNLEAGEKLIREFNKKCKYLVGFPNIGKSYDDLKIGLRGLPLDGYIILYEVINDKVTILRVVSGYRDLKSLFSEN